MTANLNLTVGQLATLACSLEVAAPKPGNVHRSADFEDLTLNDFLVSAVILGSAIDRALEPVKSDAGTGDVGKKFESVGSLILDCVSTTQSIVGSNTNLGISLLVCPLAVAAVHCPGLLSPTSVAAVLSQLGPDDCRDVYSAIRIAKAGGLGRRDENDVFDEPPDCLISAMSLAAERDLIARQYTNSMQQVCGESVSFLREGLTRFNDVNHAIVYAHVKLMSAFPDSLIARKCDAETAIHAQMLAAKAIDQLEFGSNDFRDSRFQSALSELDFWLRRDGHRRNPGTTADMIAAGLFVAINNGHLTPFLRAG